MRCLQLRTENLLTTVFTVNETNIFNKRLKFNTIITTTKQLEELDVDTAIAIRNITNSEDKSYLQVCSNINRDGRPLPNILGTPH